jgi:hypothetical protein
MAKVDIERLIEEVAMLLQENPDFQSETYPNFSSLLNFKASSDRQKRETLAAIKSVETLKNAYIEVSIMDTKKNRSPRYNFVEALWLSIRLGRELSDYRDRKLLDEISVFTIKLENSVEEYLVCKKRLDTIANQLSNDDYRRLRDILILRHNKLQDDFDSSVFEMNKCRDNLEVFMNSKFP